MVLATGCGARSALREAPREDAAADAGGLDVPRALDVPSAVDVAAALDVSPALDVFGGVDVVAIDRGVAPTDRVMPSVCGNGRVEVGEVCDLGADNVQRPAFALRQTGRPALAVLPAVGGASATSFYAYRSASSHTGFEALGVANLVLHVDRNGGALSLVFFAGIDGGLGGPVQPDSTMGVEVSGLPMGARLLLSDEPDECTLRGDRLSCDWRFQQNTDGFVLGPLPWDADWDIVVNPDFRDGVSSLRYQNGDGRALTLLPRSAVVIEHRARRALCREDCTVPRCGDGVVDAGERCDDGNVRSGDGCGATCLAFD